VTVARSTPRDRRGGDERFSFQYALDPAKVLGGLVDLAAPAEQNDDLRAGIPFEVHVCGRTDVFAPAMLGHGEPPENVRRRVSIQQGDDPQGVRLGVREGTVGELFADQGPERIRAAGTVPFLDPMIEKREKGRLERNAQAHDFDRHGSPAAGAPPPSVAAGGGGEGANPIFS